MTNIPVFNLRELGFTWETIDPFLFCVHHLDHFPRGNAQLGPAASLAGRNIGQDFTQRDGWRMYHGEIVPGFPSHPHRGFETVTVVLDGFVDHSDSHGAAGRYGNGDVQWMTAGSGLQHAEMFPLLEQDQPNRMELFQIWLNLPRAKKFARPHYKMLWAEHMAKVRPNEGTLVTLIAGELGQARALPPAPDSWAAQDENAVAIWIIELQPGAEWILPPAPGFARRSLYFFQGSSLSAAGVSIPAYHSCETLPESEISLQAGADGARILLLQGRPISERVVQYGPFVMNTEREVYEAYADYQSTQFGGWPWDRHDPVHGAAAGRFARYADGSVEKPEGAV